MKRNKDGFTLVELAIVIVIIAVLASVTIFTYAKVQVNARDSARASSVASISEALERYYRKNGEYPSCAQITQSGSQVSTLLGGLDPTILVTPTASSSTTNSISGCTDLTAGSGTDVYAYVGDGSTACSTGTACSSYTLEYRKEADGTIISVQAQHLATATPVSAPATPVVTAGMSGNNAVGTAGAVTCTTGTAQYQLQYSSTNTSTAGAWQGWSAWSSSQLSLTVAASQGYQYSFQAHARCYDGTNTSASSADSNVATVVRPINTPATPTYLTPSSFTSNVNAVVNYSSSCPSGTSIINGTMRTRAWTGGTWGPNPFGYLDSWENYSGVDKNVEYWGKYQCKTYWTTSAYSAESYNVIVVHP
ncbi:MAG TPA: prepilin-type N-terminal cleavage/methylation domain-containing protein [Verrucomicrobiae bacterium]|nr:prepilin-type N-terminal cleavage/methylation domain-containing protein [Verrucomicrobiae bacterium]